MNLRYFAILGLIVSAACPQNARAEPSSCDNLLHYLEWTQKYFASADAVFLGTVVSEEVLDPPGLPAIKTDDANSMDELLTRIQLAQSRAPSKDRLQLATFRIQESWTKLVGPKVTVVASLFHDDTGYHAPFRNGDSYLVFAFKNKDQDTLWVPVGCVSNQSINKTSFKIKVLNALADYPERP